MSQRTFVKRLCYYIATCREIKPDPPGIIATDKNYIIRAVAEINAAIYAMNIISVELAVAWELGRTGNCGCIEYGLLI